MNGPVRCDACGGMAVLRAGEWVHVDPQRAALASVGPHDPLKLDDQTTAYLRAVLGGGSR